MFHTTTLELHLILEKLAAFAVSQKAKEAILKLHPLYDFAGIASRLYEVDEARIIINQKRALPLNPLIQIEKAMDQLSKEPVLNAAHLDAVAYFLEDVTKLKFALLRHQEECKRVSSYGLSLLPCQELKEAIQLSIYQGRIQDQASSALASVRRKINLTEGQIKDKLSSLMKSNSAYMMDAMVVQRNGRYALPIKAEHKKNLEGDILDKSATGQTLYIEPRAVQLLAHKLHLLQIDEEQECLRILSELTNQCADHEKEILANIEVMLHCDILFAKARLSFSMDATSPIINDQGIIKLSNARHPLLEDKVIPLDITLGETYQGILITGPNTGGKTVAMKTVGLLALMMQCGLHIPCDSGSTLPLFEHILADIGDGQSISQNLSTFSSHITQINKVLSHANSRSLVLLDEIGAGTEPSEGCGLARAILEHLSHCGVLILSSTHFSELKQFAEEHPNFINASMCFDEVTLKPLFKMLLGKAGKSHALHIAYRLGMAFDIIDRAHQITYSEAFEHSLYPTHPAQGTHAPANHSAMPVSKALHKDIYRKSPYGIGDSVWIKSLSKSGTVLTLMDHKGEYKVMINGIKWSLNHKRLTPFIDNKELYPDDYDMRIITDTVYERKKDKLLSKGKHKALRQLQNKE